MEGIFKALWPEEETPGTFFDLARRFREARARIGLWKASAAREGRRGRYLDIRPIAEVGPTGPKSERGGDEAGWQVCPGDGVCPNVRARLLPEQNNRVDYQ